MAQHSNVARLRDADAAFEKADLNGPFALDGR
jgi:hypothetical protein